MLSTDPKEHWEAYARQDPYFAVLTEDRFAGKNLTDAHRAEFFASGEAYVDWLLAIIREHVAAGFRPTAGLDFGCGVGRLALPLARVCAAVTAVDVSPTMLRQAAENASRAGLGNLRFDLVDDFSRADTDFDLINSYIVFQHIPQAQGFAILDNLMSRLRPGGVLAVHLAYHRPTSRLSGTARWLRSRIPGINAAANLLRGQPINAPYMQMNPYDLNRAFLLLQSKGFDRLHLELTRHGDVEGAVVFGQKRPPSRQESGARG